MNAPAPPDRQTRVERRTLLGVGAVLVVAAVLRLWGIRWGLPGPDHLFSYHPDEFHSLRGALSLALAGDLNPHFFNYGTCYVYIVAVVGLLFAHPEHGIGPYLHELTWCARLVTVGFGLLTVWTVYAAGRRLYSPVAGLLAAAAVAAFPLHAVHSHYATVDVPTALWISVAVYGCARILTDGRARDYALAGVAVGLAAGTKYSGALILVAPLVAHALRARQEGGGWRRLLDRRLLLCVGLAPAAFVAVCPYAVLAWGEFREGFLFEVRHMREGEFPACVAEPSALLFHLRALSLGLGAPATAAFAAAGVALAAVRRKPGDLVLLAALVVLGGALVSTRVRYMRYDVVLLPLLALLLGSLLAWLGELGDETWHRGVGRKTVAVVMALPLLYAAGTTVCYVSAMARPDVRDQALDWLRKHVEAGSSLGLIWAPWFNVPPVDYVNGGEVLRRNPLFAGLIRSPWEIRVIGYDAGKLRAERPDFLVLSEFELRDFVRAREPKALELLGAVKEEYGVAARFVRRPIGPAWTKNPPQDWLYPFPELRVLESQEGAGELGE